MKDLLYSNSFFTFYSCMSKIMFFCVEVNAAGKFYVKFYSNEYRYFEEWI